MDNFTALASGLLFGIGLAMSGMTDTTIVLGFFDLFGQWIPDLAFVMGAAVLVTLVCTHLILKRQAPWFSEQFHLPGNNAIDWPLVAGAALFGIGWGLYGYCPGPAIAALAYGQAGTWLFIAFMLAGMYLAEKFKARL